MSAWLVGRELREGIGPKPWAIGAISTRRLEALREFLQGGTSARGYQAGSLEVVRGRKRV
jgi:hypothetical protein